MRVALDVRTVRAERAGIGNYTLELARSLAELGVDLLWCGDAGTERSLLPEGPFALGPGGPLWHLWAAGQPADVFHSPGSLFVPLLSRRPTVLTVHDLVPFRVPEASDRWSKVTHLAFKAAVRRATRLVADSAFTARDLEALLPGLTPKVTVVPLAARLAPAASAGSGFDAGYVLAVGTLEPRKNLETLLHAHACLESPPPLVLVGRVSWKAGPLESALARHPHPVHLVRDADDDRLAALYAGCGAFVFPSRYEGFGLPVVEAMACGAPVIASNATAIPEAAGDAALLVSPESPAEMARALDRVLSDQALAKELRARGRERALRRSWQDVAAETFAVYQAAARCRNPRELPRMIE